MPAIVQTAYNYDHGIYGDITGWAIDRTMRGLAGRARRAGLESLADQLASMKRPQRGQTYLGNGFTLIAGGAGR